MITTVCNVHVSDDGIEAFKAASLANAAGSRQEPGVTRFDLFQQADDPTRFILYEEYVDQDAVQARGRADGDPSGHLQLRRQALAAGSARRPRTCLLRTGEGEPDDSGHHHRQVEHACDLLHHHQ